MGKKGVEIVKWPFQKGEKAKLIWIGEPFKQNNKWMVNTYFKGGKATKKITLDWADIHFLSVDKYYTDGNLNNGAILENKNMMDINLNGVKAEYNERDWEIWGSGFKDKTKSKTFNFFKNRILYTIPVIEIIRAVLAPDRFMLNRILEMDTLENYFTYEIEGSELSIHFTSQYEQNLLKNEKISHLAWLLTNPKVFKMFNSIGANMWGVEELKCEFLFERFNIKARVQKKEKYIRVLEIVSLKKKRINAEEINIYHTSLEESETTNETKKRKYVNKNRINDRELDSEADGSTKTSEELNTFLISHEYEKVPKINRVKSGRKVKRKREDENTKKYILENGQLRTTADEGGEKLIRGLEFTSIANVEEKGELEEFIDILKLLEKRHNIKSVEVIIGDLPEGRKGKRFSRLSDGITKRKYAIGKITMMDSRVCSLIEVEREDKALSMLLLKGNILMNWKMIYSIILLGLVDESGKWSNYAMDKISQMGIDIYRNKHIKRSVNDKETYIYNKLI
ncbi:Tn7-like element transposition protein TnsE [Clostridium brassicae]|uniref:Tn7-like element transposition protein TnsE n=1 Tax=Clostridium brassicae TaxID=2999072 RepID=A0ABT4D569_9CLOT|nr:Tn7-like element transposition protein TnsE [Clostridium brassicae]MCY6957427.1 Tn7-like element transposition protein TnsE [Clostridium brassicae]